MKLELAVREVGENAAVITLSGEMDIYSSPRLLEEIFTLADGGRPFIVLDLSTLDYLDSTGIGAISAGRKKVRDAGGNIRLVSPSSLVTKVLRLTELEQTFQVFEGAEEALVARN